VDTNKEKPDKAAVYLPEDRELMLSLLKEYTERLVNICKEIQFVEMEDPPNGLFLRKSYREELDKKQEFLSRSGMTIAVKLKKVIVVASQIDEHIETSLAKRIEWDFRLNDAELALEYYGLVTGVNRRKNL